MKYKKRPDETRNIFEYCKLFSDNLVNYISISLYTWYNDLPR